MTSRQPNIAHGERCCGGCCCRWGCCEGGGGCAAIPVSIAQRRHLGEYAHAVRVTVKLFAALRERAGVGERSLELDDGARVGDVWPQLELGDEPPGLLYAVNRNYADAASELADGDEVALIPPVSGGDFRVTDKPLSLQAVVAEVADEHAGAIATFTGTVRRRSRGRTVLHLEYEAYVEMAEDVMTQLAAELERRYELGAVAIHHRVGRVEVGEPSVVIAVSAPHRQAALAACEEAIDTLKQTVPLWKKEVYEGGEEWLGRGS
jgi:molybdopterin synthase catalytic subunit/molybdopterin converting factor small subunit